MISYEEISAPSQCERSMMSWPATPGEEVLVAAGEADHLVREHRPGDEDDVVLEHRRLTRTSTSRASRPPLIAGDLVGGDDAERDERRSGRAQSWLSTRTSSVPTSAASASRVHRLVGAQCDQHGEPRRRPAARTASTTIATGAVRVPSGTSSSTDRPARSVSAEASR